MCDQPDIRRNFSLKIYYSLRNTKNLSPKEIGSIKQLKFRNIMCEKRFFSYNDTFFDYNGKRKSNVVSLDGLFWWCRDCTVVKFPRILPPGTPR